MRDSKVKVPMIITGINIFTYIIPIVILLPLLLIISKVNVDILRLIFIFLFIITFIVDLIMIFLAPLIQFALIIISVINRKWQLLVVHIPLTILFGGGSYIVFEWLTHLSV